MRAPRYFLSCPNHHRLFNILTLKQPGLNGLRLDVFSPKEDDGVLLPAYDFDLSFVGGDDQVTGVEPASFRTASVASGRL
jgi:hypothetical protein